MLEKSKSSLLNKTEYLINSHEILRHKMLTCILKLGLKLHSNQAISESNDNLFEGPRITFYVMSMFPIFMYI
jgi:hypothetical protein